MPSCSTPATLTVRPRKSATADCRCALAYVDSPESEIEGIERPQIGEEPAPGYEAAIGITPFRAGEDNLIGFYSTKKFERFVNDMRKAADNYGVEIKKFDRVDGLWQGSEEPAIQIHAVDGETGVKAFAADLGKAYNQDGVLLFDKVLPGEGPVHLSITFEPFLDRQRIVAALAMQGIDGATVLADGRLQVVGVGSDFLERAQRVAQLLGVDYNAEVGRMTLLERDAGDYDKAIEATKKPESILGVDPAASLPGDDTVSLELDDRAHLPPGVEDLGGGINQVFKVKVDGDSYIVKTTNEAQGRMRTNITPGNDAGRERAAYVMSRYIEAIDPDLAISTPQLRISKVIDDIGLKTTAAISRFIPDAKPAIDVPDYLKLLSDHDLRKASLYDAIIGNTDRHAGNFMFKGTDEDLIDALSNGGHAELHLIDHGLAFPDNNAEGFGNARFIDTAIDRFGVSDESTEYETWVMLTGEQRQLLTKLDQAWPQIEGDLRPLLDEKTLTAARQRIQWMLSHDRLVDPYGISD